MADYQDIVWEEHGPVAVCRLNRPEKLNAMRFQTTQGDVPRMARL